MNYKSTMLLNYYLSDSFFYYSEKLMKYIGKFLSASFFSNNAIFNNTHHHCKCSYYSRNTE